MRWCDIVNDDVAAVSYCTSVLRVVLVMSRNHRTVTHQRFAYTCARQIKSPSFSWTGVVTWMGYTGRHRIGPLGGECQPPSMSAPIRCPHSDATTCSTTRPRGRLVGCLLKNHSQAKNGAAAAVYVHVVFVPSTAIFGRSNIPHLYAMDMYTS